MLDPLALLRRYMALEMGKGDRPGVLGALGRGLGVRVVPGRAEPLRVWHYTSTQNALDIERDCMMFPGRRGTDGPGVYVTDLRPDPDRLRISMTLWEQWRPQSMEAFVGLPFLTGEMEPSEKYPHVWVVKKSELWITGLDDLEIGFWQGAVLSAANDRGSWLRRPLPGCR